jgi:hypothetical protein
MSETETKTTSAKRPAAKTTEAEAAEPQTYEQALEQGYVGGPAEDVDLTVAGVAAAAAEASE